MNYIRLGEDSPPNSVYPISYLYDLELSRRQSIIMFSPKDDDGDGPRNVGFFAI
jgi:hypothetical protein